MSKPQKAMHVATIKRRHGDRVYETHLIRRSFREGKRVRHETIANVSKLPPVAIDALRRSLAGETLVGAGEAFQIERSLPHGNVAALLIACKRLELPRLLDRTPSRSRTLILAMIAQRILAPGSKLATSRALTQTTLASELGVGDANEDDLYSALDWLGERQTAVEHRLGKRHLTDKEHALYDLSSSYFEGRKCPLAQFGYSRDSRSDRTQIVYGLLTNSAGVPVAVQVFDGNLHDSQTVPAQIEKLKSSFGLKEVVFVADRGMVTKANLQALAEGNINWVTALKAPQVKRLAAAGTIQPSLFDTLNMAEVRSDDFPGERLVVCRNPLVAKERNRKRDELLEATEAELVHIAARVASGSLTGDGEIGIAVGEAVKRFKMKKHFVLEITGGNFTFRRKAGQIAQEAALDGIYVLRTSVATEQLKTGDVVLAYKQLAQVERNFGMLKGKDLAIRPIHHHLEGRVRAHVFLCMLSLYVERHLRQVWAELTFADEDSPLRSDPVAKAKRSAGANEKAASKRTGSGLTAHSFQSLLAELSTQTRNTIRMTGTDAEFDRLCEPTQIQARALALADSISFK